MSEVLTLENKTKLSMGGAAEVGSFNEREITLRMKSGESFIVKGEELKIISFSKETGDVKLEGKISEMKFRRKRDIIKGLFK